MWREGGGEAALKLEKFLIQSDNNSSYPSSHAPQIAKARKRTFDIYKSRGFELSEELPGDWIRDEINIDYEYSPISPLFVFVDEIIFCTRYVTYYFLSCANSDKKDWLVFYNLSLRQLNCLIAIRTLCSRGLDVNARTQLRILYENSLLWCRLIYDRAARDAFLNSDTPELANKFWHRYISKGKLETFLNELTKGGSILWSGNIQSGILLKDAYELIGLVAHPTMISASFEARHDLINFNNGELIKRSIDNASRRTIELAIFLTTLPFGFLPRMDLGLTAGDLLVGGPVPPVHDSISSWSEYCAEIEKTALLFSIASNVFSSALTKDLGHT